MSRLERVVGRTAFDRFAREYIREHRFQSLTTEAFVEYLGRKLPEAARAVDLRTWLYGPGFPEDAPPFPSRRADAVSECLFDYQERGRLPIRDRVAGWSSSQVYFFLQMVPRPMPVEDCRALDDVLDMPHSRIAVNQSNFYEISIRSGYREVLPRVEALLGSVGRLFVVIPVFQALASTPWSRTLARPMYERFRERHHPITASTMEGVLEREGL